MINNINDKKCVVDQNFHWQNNIILKKKRQTGQSQTKRIKFCCARVRFGSEKKSTSAYELCVTLCGISIFTALFSLAFSIFFLVTINCAIFSITSPSMEGHNEAVWNVEYFVIVFQFNVCCKSVLLTFYKSSNDSKMFTFPMNWTGFTIHNNNNKIQFPSFGWKVPKDWFVCWHIWTNRRMLQSERIQLIFHTKYQNSHPKCLMSYIKHSLHSFQINWMTAKLEFNFGFRVCTFYAHCSTI